MPMLLGHAGENLIKSFEKLRLTAYKAVATEKYYTWGWGHYGADVPKDGTLTVEKAQEIFEKDVAKFVAAVNKGLKRKATQNQFDAMVSFTFNVGEQAFADSTLLKKFNAGDFAGAADEFDRWNKSGGVVLQGLKNRRAAEKALFLS